MLEMVKFTFNVEVLDNFATNIPDIYVNGELLDLPINEATMEIIRSDEAD